MKKFIASFLKRFIDQAQALRLAELAGWARDFAVFKSHRQPKRTKRGEKKPYVRGTIGVSKVSQEIMKQHDGILLSRKERRQLAREHLRFLPRKERQQVVRNGSSPLAFKPVYNR